MTHAQAAALVRELELRTMPASAFIPHSPTERQEVFLACTSLEAMFGGAAGGGKSDAILMGALQHVDIPNYAALILRRTFKDLSLPGALMDRARQWLTPTPAKWNDKEKTWRFPSGATLTFGYMESEADKYQYQSAEFQYIGVDELTQFTQTQYTYMLSRLRRLAGSTIPIRARSATNPGGVGHFWVKQRFVDEATRAQRAFIPSLLEDNPHLDREQYEFSLAELDSVTYAQLRRGKWVHDSHGLLYKFNADRNLVPGRPPGHTDWLFVLGVDLGTSERKPTTAFALVAFSPALNCAYIIRATKHAGMIPSTIAQKIIEINQDYPLEQVVVDAGGLGKGYVKEFQLRYHLPAAAAEKSDKLGYRKLMNGDLEKRHLLVVDCSETEDLINEINELTWNEKGTDNEANQDNHVTDAALYAWRRARHWRRRETSSVPPVGTLAYAEWDENRMRKSRMEYVKRAKDRRPWWKKQRRRR